MNEFTSRKIPKRKRPRDWFGETILLFMLVSMFFYRAITIDLLVILILVMWGLVIAVRYRAWRSWHNEWQNIANKMGLYYESYNSKQLLFAKWARIHGSIQGFDVAIERFTRWGRRRKTIYTSITLTRNHNFVDTITILKRVPFRSVMPLRGNKTLRYFRLEDSEFDKKLEIKSSSEQFARDVLMSYNVKQKLLDIQAQAPHMQILIDDDTIYYHEKSNIMDGAYLSAVITALAELAEAAEK